MADELTLPLLSVVVPCYKIAARVSLLEDCVRSLTYQTYSNIEVVIVDDGSPDRSVEEISAIVDSMGSRFVGMRLVRLEENLGVSEARNSGIREAKGDLVAFLDFDDLWMPEFAQGSVDILVRDPCVDVVLGATILYRQFKSKRKAHLLDLPSSLNTTDFARFCAWHLINNFPVAMGSAVVCRRSLFDRFPALWMDHYLSKRSAEDVYFGFKMLALGVRPYYIEAPSVVHRGFFGESSRSKKAHFRLDEMEIQEYIWKNAGQQILEMVSRDAPECSAAVKSRVAFINDLFNLKRSYSQASRFFGIPACVRRPRLWKSWVQYWTLMAMGERGSKYFEYITWKRFLTNGHELLLAQDLIDRCAVASASEVDELREPGSSSSTTKHVSPSRK